MSPFFNRLIIYERKFQIMAQKLAGVRPSSGGYKKELAPEYLPNPQGPMIVVGQPERLEGWDPKSHTSDGVFKKLKVMVIDATTPVAEPFNLSILSDIKVEVGDVLEFPEDVEACEIYCRNYRCLHNRKPDVYFRTKTAKVVGHVNLFSDIEGDETL